MKAINNICRYAAIVFGLASLAFFFVDFAVITAGGDTINFVASQLAFGSEVKSVAGVTYDMAISADILVTLLLTAFGVVSSGLAVKFKKARYAASAFGIASAIYMLVIALYDATKFIDKRPIQNVTEIVHTPFIWVLVALLFVFAAISIAYLLIDDYLEVLASNGEKLTIFKRVIRFFRDYKSEVKKIVWPGYKDVIKNTLIVLIMCLIVGILIWAVDFGLSKLITLILGA